MTEFTDAIQAGDIDRVAALIDADPTIVEQAQDNVTPILFAIYRGKMDIARLLLDRGAPVSFPEACALGDTDRAKAMLAENRQMLDERSQDGFPPLGLAIFFGHRELARSLIEQGADVNAAATNAQRVAPLHAAAAVRDRDTMRLLLERGADPNARQQGGFTALHGAASRGDREMAELLLEHGADPQAMTDEGLSLADVARKYGSASFVEWLEQR